MTGTRGNDVLIPGALNLITDVAGLKVGNAQDITVKSGSTVVTADAPFTASIAVMGGAPGTRETDLLAPDKSVAEIDALVLSGGSAYGLDACSGVSDALRAAGRGYRVGDVIVPIVPGAIIFDLLSGGKNDWDIPPYRALGRMAYEAASQNFALGSVGAGTGALSATLKGGLGSASFTLPGQGTVGALVAANPMGSVTTPGERHFWAAPFELGREFGGLGPDQATGLGRILENKKRAAMNERANTTIAIVATDIALSKAECQRVAYAAHDGIARACVPAHSPADGDLVFALSTGRIQAGAHAPSDLMMIGHAAALCLTRAIARAIFQATPAHADLLPCWRSLNMPQEQRNE